MRWWWQDQPSGDEPSRSRGQGRSVYEEMYDQAPEEEDRVPWQRVGEIDPRTGQWTEPPDWSGARSSRPFNHWLH